MTPEERQEKIDFIIASYADFSAKMDRLDTDLVRHEREHETLREGITAQGDDIEGLKRLADQFLKIIRVEHEVLMADRKTRLAELEAEQKAREVERKARQAELEAERQAREAERQAREAERERRRELEGRVDGIEEMTKFLRELLENNLRPPDKPPETEN